MSSPWGLKWPFSEYLHDLFSQKKNATCTNVRYKKINLSDIQYFKKPAYTWQYYTSVWSATAAPAKCCANYMFQGRPYIEWNSFHFPRD